MPKTQRSGQGLAEYALILALIAIVAIIALIFLGGQVSKILSQTDRNHDSENMASDGGLAAVYDATGSRLLVSGPDPVDGSLVSVRLVCPGQVGPWYSPSLNYAGGWVTVIDPGPNQGCLLQAGEQVSGSVTTFGQVSLTEARP